MPKQLNKEPWRIPEGAQLTRCRGCAEEIYFVPYRRKSDGRDGRMPCNPDGVPHWATCTQAHQFRKGGMNE